MTNLAAVFVLITACASAPARVTGSDSESAMLACGRPTECDLGGTQSRETFVIGLAGATLIVGAALVHAKFK